MKTGRESRKPFFVERRVAAVVDALRNGHTLDPEDRGWFFGAFDSVLNDPKLSLDRELGLKSRLGGRGFRRGSVLPERDRQLRAAAQGLSGTVKQKAQAIIAKRKAGALPGIPGRVPGVEQLARILKRADVIGGSTTFD